MDHIEAYIFPQGNRKLVDHLVMGVSLGGHAAWLSLFHEPRISAGVVVIGCCDYAALMYNRAKLSHRPSFTQSPKPGAAFIGSIDYPEALHQSVLRIDPASLLFGRYDSRHEQGCQSAHSDPETVRLRTLVQNSLGGKKILNLAGGSDKLVPHALSEPLLRFLSTAAGPRGLAEGANMQVKDLVYPGIGHQVCFNMTLEIESFVCDHLSQSKSADKSHI